MRWIDSHVHLFSQNDSDNSGIPLVYGEDALNTPDLYFKMLEQNKPEGVIIVDFSKSKDSEHVVNSLDELKKTAVKAAGVIKANLGDERTLEWIKRDDIKAIRLYAKESVPDVSGQKWADVFASLKKDNKHILIFGEGENLLALVKQIPADITILIDHLGCPKLPDDKNFDELLEIAKGRGNLYFKGPGYRTSLDSAKVKPVLHKIVAKLGVEKLILGASDAPFAGPVMEPGSPDDGKKFCEVMDYKKVLKFVEELAGDVAKNDSEKDKILYGNAKGIYGF